MYNISTAYSEEDIVKKSGDYFHAFWKSSCVIYFESRLTFENKYMNNKLKTWLSKIPSRIKMC